jgi:mycothiol synthase
MDSDTILLANAPHIPGLRFRHFRGESDYPGMAMAIRAASDQDGTERSDTVESIASAYAHLTNSNPYEDMIFATMDGGAGGEPEVIGYSRGWWYDDSDGLRIYSFVGFLIPAWRRKRIGAAMLHWMEARLREIGAQHPPELHKTFQAGAAASEVGLAALLESFDYAPVRYFFEMLRPDLENIPDFPLPEGLEVRPVLPEHYRPIWDAEAEAFLDHWNSCKPNEEDYQAWLENPASFTPELWPIAWDVATDQVAGQVRTFIDHEQNRRYNRKRGYTENISVRRPWRRRGLARALIARSLRLQKEAGMSESALFVDAQNISGATRVYEACGFQVVMQGTIYRKGL